MQPQETYSRSSARNRSTMEATLMNLVGFVSTAVLSLTLIAAAPMYAQQEEDKTPAQEQKNGQQEDKNTQQEKKNSQQQDKNNQQEQKNAQQQQRTQQAQRASGNGSGRIPDDKFKANFGREHSFHVSQADYSNGRRFQYGGYSFGF